MSEQKKRTIHSFQTFFAEKNFISSFQDKNMVTDVRLSIVHLKIQDCRHHIYILKSCFKYFSAKNSSKQMNLNNEGNCKRISWDHSLVSIEYHQQVLNHKNNSFRNEFSLSILE